MQAVVVVAAVVFVTAAAVVVVLLQLRLKSSETAAPAAQASLTDGAKPLDWQLDEGTCSVNGAWFRWIIIAIFVWPDQINFCDLLSKLMAAPLDLKQ